MVQICKCVKLPEKLLLGFVDNDTFKVYYSDVGIFKRIVNNDTKTILLNDMKIYKGIIMKNYVANQLKSNKVDSRKQGIWGRFFDFYTKRGHNTNWS